MGKNSWGRFFHGGLREGVREGLIEITRSWLVPVLTPLIIGILGYSNGLPTMYIFLGVLAAFAFTTNGLLRFNEWRFQRSPRDKIDFVQPSVSNVVRKEDLGRFRGIRIGFGLKSSALFPMEIEVTNIRTRVMDRVPPSPEKPLNIVKVGMMGVASVRHSLIDLSGIDLKNQAKQGSMEFNIRYGRPGGRDYELKKRFTFEIQFDGNGRAKGIGNLSDVTSESSD